jgi:hypothetical protein
VRMEGACVWIGGARARMKGARGRVWKGRARMEGRRGRRMTVRFASGDHGRGRGKVVTEAGACVEGAEPCTMWAPTLHS